LQISLILCIFAIEKGVIIMKIEIEELERQVIERMRMLGKFPMIFTK